jgi:hypothetical protein
MFRKQITRFLVGVFVVIAFDAVGSAQSQISEPGCDATLEAQGSGLIAVETLTRAEQRVEALRSRLLEIQTKEMELQDLLDELDYRMSPENIQRALLFVGSVRPMDERRDALRTRLENEKARVNKQLELLASSRMRLEAAISDAERQVERLRRN